MARSNELNEWLDHWSNKINMKKNNIESKKSQSWVYRIAKYWQRFDFLD